MSLSGFQVAAICATILLLPFDNQWSSSSSYIDHKNIMIYHDDRHDLLTCNIWMDLCFLHKQPQLNREPNIPASIITNIIIIITFIKK